jgi:hypothetical protein
LFKVGSNFGVDGHDGIIHGGGLKGGRINGDCRFTVCGMQGR